MWVSEVLRVGGVIQRAEYLLAVARQEDGSYIASSEQPPVHGWGNTLVKALSDYGMALVEWCELQAVDDVDV